MGKKVYDKLIREKIPAVIHNTGKTYEIKFLEETEYIERLNEKL